jgi:hypothetical protein
VPWRAIALQWGRRTSWGYATEQNATNNQMTRTHFMNALRCKLTANNEEIKDKDAQMRDT